MSERRMQSVVVGVGRRIGQDLRGVVHRGRAHGGSSSHLLEFTGVKTKSSGPRKTTAGTSRSVISTLEVVQRVTGRNLIRLVVVVLLLVVGCGRGDGAAPVVAPPSDPALVHVASGS